MRFTCKTSVLKAVQTAKKAISSNPSIPYFFRIHLIASDNQLENVMDLNMAIGCQIEANVAENGNIVIPAKYSFWFASHFAIVSSEEVNIYKNSDESTVSIESGKANQIVLMTVLIILLFLQ